MRKVLYAPRRSRLLLPAIMTFWACATSTTPLPPSQRLQPATGTYAPYVLQLGDTLGVKFYQNPELDEDVVIRPDGMISLQLIGDVRAAGLTPEELAAQLRQQYASELANPKINVIVRSLGGYRIYVGGEVGRQGVVQLSGGLTLYQAIQEAGGFLATAHRKQVVLIRGVHEGRPVGHTIDIRPVQSGEHPEDDVPLQAYDIVFVPKSKIANVDTFVDQYIRQPLPVNPAQFLFLGF